MLEAKTDFLNSLDEVDLDLSMAAVVQKNSVKYSLFLKAGILLLCAKFECFIESSVEEYCQEVNRLRLKASQIPDSLRLQTAKTLLPDGTVGKVRSGDVKGAQDALMLLAPLWCKCDEVCEIRVDSHFNYGRHGEDAVRKLLHRIGIEDVFRECTISLPAEGPEGSEGTIEVDVISDINALTVFRNQIIHTDANPNLTHSQIKGYRDHLSQFAQRLESLLSGMLAQLDVASRKSGGVVPPRASGAV